MASTSKNVVLGSMAVAVLIVILAIVDIATGFPFAKNMVFDIMFILSAFIVLYLGWESYRDLA